MQHPRFEDILVAHERIKPFIHRTPVLSSVAINEITGKELFFKCENFQKAGAFKYRGAYNSILQLNEKEARAGVVTHSSGNHAGALAKAAKENGLKAYIVMPENAPEAKVKAVTGYGAEITFCEPTLEAREATCKSIQDKTGAVFIPPYNFFDVICGQGTAAIELLEEQNGLDAIITPVGGGGLLCGTAISAKSLKPNIKVFAGEPENAADAYRSFRSGKWEPSVAPNTIADGLLTSLGSLNFEIIQKHVDDIFTVQEKSIVEAMRMIWERMKIVVEPSSAVTLAAILEKKVPADLKKIGVILSGGNVDLERLPF